MMNVQKLSQGFSAKLKAGNPSYNCFTNSDKAKQFFLLFHSGLSMVQRCFKRYSVEVCEGVQISLPTGALHIYACIYPQLCWGLNANSIIGIFYAMQRQDIITAGSS